MMFSRKLMGDSLAVLAAAGAMLLVATTAQAAISPVPAAAYATSDIQSAGCLLGAHVGPLGACLGGHTHHRHCWIDHEGNRVCN
jgi:hypothetical protein